MNEARQLAASIGVDRLSWEITDHPETGYSRRFVPGSPEFESITHEVWDHSGLGNAIPGATPKARIEVRTLLPTPVLKARHGQPFRVRARIQNLCDRTFPAQATYGRRLVRLGAQLCDERGSLLDRDFARAWLPHSLGPGERTDVAIEVPTPQAPGHYTLKFDLVSEGIDWFERCGSPTTTKPLVVT